MKRSIRSFLETYGTKVQENEDSAYVELMMDNHKCIVWENEQWYIPEDSVLWDEEDEMKYKFLTECFILN